jgi:hypothetical protein
MKHTTSQFLYNYWNEIRAGRLAPKRFEIEPARIGAILPDAFILERGGDDGQFVYRLAGTRIGERYGAERRHADFDDAFEAEDRDTLGGLLYEVAERGGVGWITVDVEDGHKNKAQLEYLLLPLIHTQDRIDRILGTVSLTTNSDWIGLSPITSQRIVEHDIVWPDGRPFELARTMAKLEPMVLEPQLRNARIVTANRRQFRVYDGGLAQSDEKSANS